MSLNCSLSSQSRVGSLLLCSGFCFLGHRFPPTCSLLAFLPLLGSSWASLFVVWFAQLSFCVWIHIVLVPGSAYIFCCPYLPRFDCTFSGTKRSDAVLWIIRFVWVWSSQQDNPCCITQEGINCLDLHSESVICCESFGDAFAWEKLFKNKLYCIRLMEDNKFSWPFSLKFINVSTWKGGKELEDVEPLGN